MGGGRGGGSVTMEMPRGGGVKRAVSEGGDEDATACAGAKGGRRLHQSCERRTLNAMEARSSGSDAVHSHQHSGLR